MALDSTYIGQTLSFELLSGIKYVNYKLLSILDVGTVTALGYDAAAGHAQNYPYMPSDSLDDYTSYMYAKFVDAEKNILYVGIPWVKDSTITVLTDVNYNCLITNPTAVELDTFRSILIASGFDGRYKLSIA